MYLYDYQFLSFIKMKLLKIMNNIIVLIMPATFIINMSSKVDRKKHMLKQIRNLSNDFKVEFFEAIDGNNENELSKYKFKTAQWFDPFNKKPLTKGEIGCALSHYILWEKIVNEKIEHAIIFEDDILIPDDFVKRYNSLLTELPEEYDLVYFNRKRMNNNEVKKSDNIFIAKYSYWTCAYQISYHGAKRLLRSNYINNIIPVDEFLPIMYDKHYPHEEYKQLFNNKKKIKAFAVVNKLVDLAEFAFLTSDTYHSDSYNSGIGGEYKFNDTNTFMVYTVATTKNDAYKRFCYFCNKYNIPYKVLGLGSEWTGGDMNMGPGGGMKVNLLKKELEIVDNKDKKLICFTDSYDVTIVDNAMNIIKEFFKICSKEEILFSAEKTCWPDKELESKYPFTQSYYKYLNSGGFMGYADKIYNIIQDKIKDNEDDQLYYTKKFLNSSNIKLDYNCQIFQTLNGSVNDIKYNNYGHYENKLTQSRPKLLHGNGPETIKRYLNYLENYSGLDRSPNYGYKPIIKIDKYNLPIINVVFILYGSSTQVNECCNFINIVDYPKNRMTVTLLMTNDYNINIKYNNKIINNNIDKLYNYLSNFKKNNRNEYTFVIDNMALLNEPSILIDLLEADKTFVGPMIKKPGLRWSNFWGDISSTGYYKLSANYSDIINYREMGLWNVPYLTNTYLFSHKIFDICTDLFEPINNMDLDMSVCKKIRDSNMFMYVLNIKKYGDIIDISNVELSDVIYDDKRDAWKHKYLHSNFLSFLQDPDKLNYNEPCLDVYQFPIFTKEFCEEIINLSEKSGNWSKGGESYYDSRIKNKENYPTQDIHLKQLGLEEAWNYILHNYIAKLASKFYSNYKTKDANITFVVKYNPETQNSLEPHHDSSTYTINIALNEEYEGGGCRFLRQDVSVTGNPSGYALIHPGKLTHYHEGLPVTKGTRYILVSFIN